MRKMLRAKIHRATVTGANLDYEGSIALPPSLFAAADILPNEAVNVWNVTSGTRFETYAIFGREGAIEVNGAAAHLVRQGDIVILACYTFLDEEAAHSWEPKVVFVDSTNQIRELRREEFGRAA